MFPPGVASLPLAVYRDVMTRTGVQTTTYLPGDLHRRWKDTGKVTGDGRPVPLSRLVELGLAAFWAQVGAEGGVVPADPAEVVIARKVREGLAEAGLLADSR